MSLISGNVIFNSGSINCSTNANVIVGNSKFCSNAKNCGAISSGTFFDISENFGSVEVANFTGTSSNKGSVCTASFLGSSINSGNIQNATFCGISSNLGLINSSGLFYESSSNCGIISGNAMFSGSSSNLGTICGNACFLDSAYNDGGCIFGIATINNGDPYFLNNTMLLNGDGSNNQTNACFLDSSSQNLIITGSGAATQGSFSPYNPEGWSSYFNGSSYLTLPAAFSTKLSGIGTTPITFEMWVYPTSFSSANSYFTTLFGNNQSAATNGKWQIALVSNASLAAANVNFFYSNVSTGLGVAVITTSLGVLKNKWSHIAVVIDSTTPSSSIIDIYINGVKTSFTGRDLSTQNMVYSVLQIGGFNTQSNYFNGYISNFKITKNEKVYTNSFTPSNLALKTTSQNTTASNVLLLALQNNRLIDNSINQYALTNTGGVSMQPLDPFTPTSVYNAKAHGGSAYFNGASSLSFVSNSSMAFGTGNFTIDFWIYPTIAGVGGQIFKTGASFNGSVYDVAVAYAAAGVVVVNFWPTGATPTLRLNSANNSALVNVWTHVAIVRSGTGANQTKLYINGVENGTTTQGTSGTLNYNFTGTGTGFIGRSDAAGTFYTGYVSNVRMVKGSALYTGPFVLPTSPTTAVSGTSLLLNFNNAGIVDRSNKIILSTTGDVKISTSQIKYGTGSMYFDGVGDYLSTPNSELFKFGTGDFTVEWWWYLTVSFTTTYGPCIGQKLGESNGGWVIYRNTLVNSTRMTVRIAGPSGAGMVDYSTTVTPSSNVWQHWALVRSGTTLTWYCNGVACGVTTGVSTDISDTNTAGLMYVGFAQTWSYVIPASYIDDLRITKGVARYTANFTPPQAALKLT